MINQLKRRKNNLNILILTVQLQCPATFLLKYRDVFVSHKGKFYFFPPLKLNDQGGRASTKTLYTLSTLVQYEDNFPWNFQGGRVSTRILYTPSTW